MKNRMKEFINNFVDGVDVKMDYTDKTTLYVDCELQEELDVEEVDNNILESVMIEIVAKLKDLGYNAYIESSNEITCKNN